MLGGRVAIVTGANHGIGAATAEALAGAGAAVLLTYLRLADTPEPATPAAYGLARRGDATEVLKRIQAAGGRAAAHEADLSDPATPGRLFDRAEAEFGPVDILVNNASGWVSPPDTFKAADGDRLGRRLQPVSPAVFDQLFAVDARAAALLIGELARRHRAHGRTWGRIVSLISGGQSGFPEEVTYGAAKAALASYTLAAATELASQGITANCVHPPVTDTGWVTDSVRAFVAASPDHVHVAAPEDVAAVILWLTSDAARLVTGNTLILR